MESLGILVNAHAGRVRRDPQMVARVVALLPPGHVQVTADVSEVEPALRDLRELGVDTVGVVGGDGTVGQALTLLLRVWPEAKLPSIALIGGGTVNTIPHSLGAHRSPESTIERLIEAEEPRSESRRPAVRVQPEGGEARCGMIFGNGVTTRWLEAYYANDFQGVRGALEVIGRAVGSAFAGGELASALFEPFRAKCEVDGEAIAEQAFTVMGASGVRDVGLGFRPFHSAGRDPERIHFLCSGASALRLASELPGLWLGWRGSVLSHYSARRISIRFECAQPWSIDADLFPPASALEITPTVPLRFVSV